MIKGCLDLLLNGVWRHSANNKYNFGLTAEFGTKMAKVLLKQTVILKYD